MKLTVMGDTHANWGMLNGWLNKQKPDVLIVCGDFGYWPGIKGLSLKQIKNPVTDIYWCDGNHENHEALRNRKTDEFVPNVFYIDRGVVQWFPFLGWTLFLGGADSIDKKWRTEHVDWFHEEVLMIHQLDAVGDVHVDTIISHTCPKEFDIRLRFDDMYKTPKIYDPSREVLSIALEQYKPTRWFFGHWHVHQEGEYNGTKWTALGDLGGANAKSWETFDDGKRADPKL